MAQEPSHPSHGQDQKQGGGGGEHHQRGTGTGHDNTRSSSSSSNNNNQPGGGDRSNWLQLGLSTPSISLHEQQQQQHSEQQKITELQLFTATPSPAPPAPGPSTTHIARPVQGQAQLPFPFFSSSPGLISARAAAEAGPSGSDAGPSTSGSATNARVVILPPRPQAGVWFALRASRNQRKEPWLPQISRSFIRIRDGRMTISMVMKYLVNRLGLEHESQVEITCKGQRLHPGMTLEQVRDHIWCSREAGPSVPSPSNTVTNDHLMTLDYGRIA